MYIPIKTPNFLFHVLPTEACEDMSQFGRVDESVALLVKDLETFDEVLHTPLLLLPAHRVVDREKLLKTNSLSSCPRPKIREKWDSEDEDNTILRDRQNWRHTVKLHFLYIFFTL
jgi:hypothetical protein